MIWASFMTRRRERTDDWAIVYTVAALYLVVLVAYTAVAA